MCINDQTFTIHMNFSCFLFFSTTCTTVLASSHSEYLTLNKINTIIGISCWWRNSELQSPVSRVYSQCRRLHDLLCSTSTLHSPRGDECLFDITPLSFICPWMRDLSLKLEEGTHNIWRCLLFLLRRSSRWTHLAPAQDVSPMSGFERKYL